jgi:uncharacterized membrane protein
MQVLDIFKWILRGVIVLVVAFALGLGFFYLIQNTSAASAASFRSDGQNFEGFRGGQPPIGQQFPGSAPRNFEGGDRFRGGGNGFSIASGMFGIAGHILLITIVTVIIVLVQQLFSHKPAKADVPIEKS